MDTVSRSGGASWLPDLEAYLKGHPICSGGDEEHSVSERQGLVAAVKAAPQSAEAWRALLIFEEAHSSNITQQQPGGGDPSRVSLYHLYYWATQEVPRSKNQQKEAYLQLWLGFARQQWARSPDDARDTFKTLKNQHIGDASARLYYEWAVLEHSAGYISKALGIIAKGMRADAQPASLLQQLQGELQSGTFDLKAAGPATETITLDCGTVAQHAATTPAPSIGLGVKASLSGHPSTVRAPPSVLATAGHPRGSSMASCLKAPAAATAAAGAGAGQHDHHVARAVTFAADVHDAGVVLGAHGQPHRAGSVSASSQRTAAYTVEGHSGFLSNASSSPSRSMASGHDGTMPFSSGAVSYKSSTTESSTIDGLEEATISCGVTAAAAGEKGAAAVKPNTAPLAGAMTPAGGGGGGNTATLGLKRFGFKSRALRVGGSATDAPAALTAAAEQSTAAAAAAAATEAPNASDEEAAAAGPASSSGAIAGDASWDVNGAGRKRRAAAESVPSPNVSPKLAAAVRHGQQCRVQPGEDAADEDGPAGASNCQDQPCAGQELSGSQGSGSGAVLAAAADPTTSTDEDSVPLVGSRLAARAQDRGTPMAAGRGIEAVVQGLGLWSSPVEGQLPSSLETTPSEVLPAADGTSTSSRHASKCAPSRGRQETSSSQQHQQAPPSSHQQVERSRRPLAAVPCPRAAVQPAGGDEDVPAAPTVVLPDVATVTVTPAGPGRRGLVDPALQASTSHWAQASSEARQPAAAAAAREPLRPLQTQQRPPSAATQPEAPGKKQQQVAHVDAASQAAVATQAAQQRPQQPQQVQRQQAAPVQQQQQQARPHDKQQQQPPAAQQPDPAAVRQQPHQPPQQQRQRQAAQAPEPQVQQQQQQQRQAPPQHQQQRQALPQQQQQAPPQQQHHHQAPPQQQQQQAVRQLRPKEDPQTVFVQGVRYHKLECVGRGGSSKVFKVMGPGCKIYALKRIKLAGRDEEAASGFIDEINLLNSLRDKPNIIQLVESQVFTEEGLIYMVQEYGEIDLARLLAKHAASRKEAGALKDNLDENFIRLYWQQMLQAVAGVHEQRIVHSDLKPANFLLVEGQLKLIDFGIAKAINGDTTSIARESQVGTLNYMSPEAILGGTNNILGGPPMKVGRPSDVWSLGCILYQMVYGRTPFADLPFVPKMHAICNPQHRVSFPELANKDLMHVMQRCLDRDPKTRITLQELLDHSFLHPNRVAQPAATAAPPMLSEEQMKLLVAQLQAQLAAGASAGVPDLDKLTRELMQKLGTATLNSSSSASSSGNSSPRGTAGQQSAAQGTAAAHRQQQQPQQRQAGTGGLAGPDGSRPSSSRSRIPTAPQAGQPGWR